MPTNGYGSSNSSASSPLPDMAKTDIWMPLFIADYLADTQHLTRDEHGGYFLLLMAYWRNAGPLPDDDKRLAAIVKASAREWKQMRHVMAEFFVVSEGKWSHKRADAELKDAAENAAKHAKRARNAAEKRWGKQCSDDATSNATSIPTSNASAHACTMLEQCPSPSPTPNNTLTESGDTATTVAPPPGQPPADAGHAPQKSQIAPDFAPDPPNRHTALSLSLDIESETARFVAHYTATGEWRANWQAQFRKWLLDSMQHNADRTRRQSGHNGSGGGLPWWSTDQTILAKGRELKLDPRPGESMAQFKGRVSEAIAHLEGHP